MPWCPNCKTEYQEGYTTCSDCGTDLVEDLKQAENFVPIFHTSNEKLGEKLVHFFEYSDLRPKMEYDDSTELYTVYVLEEEEKEAKKLYDAFYFVEATRLINERNGITESEESKDSDEEEIYHEIDPNELEEVIEETDDEKASIENTAIEEEEPEHKNNSHSTAYVMKSEQYKELSSTVWVFMLFGIVGLAVVILNVTNIIPLFDDLIANVVMTALFLVFLYIGVSTNQKAKKVKAEIYEEDKLTYEINSWLKANITEEFLDSIHDDSISEGTNHIKKMDTIKEMLLKEFGSLDLAYVDRLIDDFYNNIDIEE